MRRVDCRDCKHFVQLMDAYINIDNFDVVADRCRGKVLGYCMARRNCVTYFKGFCSLYEDKRIDRYTLFSFSKKGGVE